MKTFKLIGMALVAIFYCVNFVSCHDDEEVGGNYNELIVGAWVTSYYDEYDEEYYEVTTTFYSNGTGITLEEGQTQEGGDTFKWRISGKTITLTFDSGASSQATIEELSEHTLIITGCDEDTGETITEYYTRK